MAGLKEFKIRKEELKSKNVIIRRHWFKCPLIRYITSIS